MMIQAIKYPTNPHPTNNASMIQATRISVGSTSRYSATPPQTPAIFLFFRERVSLLCGEGGTNIAAPQWQQKLTFSSYSLPHCGQYMAETSPFTSDTLIYVSCGAKVSKRANAAAGQPLLQVGRREPAVARKLPPIYN